MKLYNLKTETKQKCLYFNAKLEVGILPNSEIARWYGLTSSKMFIILKEKD
jgi:hypothetical protein